MYVEAPEEKCGKLDGEPFLSNNDTFELEWVLNKLFITMEWSVNGVKWDGVGGHWGGGWVTQFKERSEESGWKDFKVKNIFVAIN